MKFRGVNSKQKSRPGQPFSGEIMTCKNCGRQQKSDPGRSSQWTAITIEGQAGIIYFCPDCFGNGRTRSAH